MAGKSKSKRPMKPEDILRIRWVSEPRLSPDGGRVAYVVTTLDDSKNEYRSHIHVVDAASGESLQLTNGPKRDTAPAWSPDGRHLAFVSERGEEKAQVWIIGAGGGEAWRLTKTEQPAANPAWSPDGRRIAFTSRLELEPPGKGPDGKPLPKVRKITTLKYKSNGEGFVEDRRNHIFLVDVDFSAREPREARQLTRGDYSHSAPKWSPDGARIAFTSARHTNRDRDAASDLWLVDAPAKTDAGTPPPKPVRLTRTVGPVSSPAWSPNGREIAYLGHTDKRSGTARHNRLWVVAASGGEPQCLTLGLDRNCSAGGGLDAGGVGWSADSKHVIFTVLDSGNSHIYRIAAKGGKHELVAGGDRQVSGVSIEGGRIAFAASDPTHPAEVVWLDEAAPNARQITHENAAWLAEVDLAEPKELRLKSADGTPLQAWVMRPPGVSGPVPCLLNVHGGPKTQYGNTFFDEFQIYAGAGYAVVYGNPRGSDGYSEDFATAIRGAWGEKDWQDVTAIADGIGGLSFVDQTRVGVMGGSYGGFMTSWAVGHTDRFRAACSERAVNNAYSMVGTSDIGFSFQIHQVGALPYKDPDRFLRMSPIHYAANIRTPLLILHSENDLRCPIEQAEQLYVALKLQRRPVEFWRFPEENHEMSRSGKPKHRLKRFQVILDWFNRRMPAN